MTRLELAILPYRLLILVDFYFRRTVSQPGVVGRVQVTANGVHGTAHGERINRK